MKWVGKAKICKYLKGKKEVDCLRDRDTQSCHVCVKTRSATTTEAQLRICHQKWLPYQILVSNTVKNVQINPQTTEIWTKKLNDCE